MFTYDCCLKNLVRTPRGIYTPQAGAKKRFMGLTLDFAMEHDINNRKETFQSTGTPLHAPQI